MKVVLVRHGETEDNFNGIAQGQIHGKLTEKGKQQAREIGVILSDESFSSIYSSSLKRCIDTTNLIIKSLEKSHDDFSISPIYDDRMKEMALGVLEGTKVDSAVWNELQNDPLHWKSENGESFMVVYERVGSLYKELSKMKNKNILIVGHQGSIKALEGHFLGLGPEKSAIRKTFENCGIRTYVRTNGVWSLEKK